MEIEEHGKKISDIFGVMKGGAVGILGGLIGLAVLWGAWGLVRDAVVCLEDDLLPPVGETMDAKGKALQCEFCAYALGYKEATS